MLYSEEKIRKQINELYQKNPKIHITWTQTRPKIAFKGAQVMIIGCYLHFFRIEAMVDGKPQCFAIRYADINAKQISVEELPA